MAHREAHLEQAVRSCSLPRPARAGSALADFAVLRNRRGIYASRGPLYCDALFGRDSLEAAEDLLDTDRTLAEDVILALAELQAGGCDHGRSDAEPGVIPHEFRSVYVCDHAGEPPRRISPESAQLLQVLRSQWGDPPWFFSVDATPLFARLVARYTQRYATALLERGVPNTPGRTVRDAFWDAVEWVARRVETGDNLLVYQRHNPVGLRNQTWRDSQPSHADRSGRWANPDHPIASLGVQGLAWDALMAGAAMPPDQATGRRWARAARLVQWSTMHRLYMARSRYFAMGLAQYADGRAHLLDSATSDAGLLLGSGLLDTLHPKRRQQLVTQITERLFSRDFLTDVGIRCRALSEAGLNDFQDYHGSCAVWIKDTWDIACGLRAEGLPRLAEQLEHRMLNAVNIAAGNLEFFWVDTRGQVCYRPVDADSPQLDGVIVSVNIPEEGQAWTASAILALKRRRGMLRGGTAESAPAGWRRELEDRVLVRIPQQPLLKWQRDIDAAWAGAPRIAVDCALGRQREDAAIARDAEQRARESGGHSSGVGLRSPRTHELRGRPQRGGMGLAS